MSTPDPHHDHPIVALLLAIITAWMPGQIAADTDRDVARIDADTRVRIAEIDAETRIKVAEIQSRER